LLRPSDVMFNTEEDEMLLSDIDL